MNKPSTKNIQGVECGRRCSAVDRAWRLGVKVSSLEPEDKGGVPESTKRACCPEWRPRPRGATDRNLEPCVRAPGT